jgi:hypothetical protein
MQSSKTTCLSHPPIAAKTFPQKYFKTVAYFLPSKNPAFFRHYSPSKHHKFTIEKPRESTLFSPPPLKNAHKSRKIPSAPHPKKIPGKKRFRMTKWTGRVNG